VIDNRISNNRSWKDNRSCFNRSYKITMIIEYSDIRVDNEEYDGIMKGKLIRIG